MKNKLRVQKDEVSGSSTINMYGTVDVLTVFLPRDAGTTKYNQDDVILWVGWLQVGKLRLHDMGAAGAQASTVGC